MKNVLVIGSTGQIGSELTMKLRKTYHQGRIVAGYIPGSAPTGDLLESGPAEQANVCNGKQIAEIVDKYDIDTIYNLAALLSATAERLPLKAWDIQMNGLINVLEVAREKHCAVFTPSSIGSFGPDTPRDNTPQDTIQRPTSMYGVTKVATELLSDYYFHKYGVDTRSVRFPGLISYKTLPGGREGRGVRVPAGPRHLPRHDVYAGRHQGGHQADGGGPALPGAPQFLQHRLDEFRPGRGL